MSDVGRVEDSFAEPRTWNMIDGKQAVSLDVRRQSGTNTVAVDARVAPFETTRSASLNNLWRSSTNRSTAMLRKKGDSISRNM